MQINKKKSASLKGKITFINVTLITIAITVTVIITLMLSVNILERNITSNIKNVSEMLSKSDMVRDSLINNEVKDNLITYIDDLIPKLNDVDIIVIADNNGKRYYHPDKEKIGQSFTGGDEERVLTNGESYISEAKGTLGNQKRAFAPIKDKNGNQIGFVMTSTLLKNLNKLKIDILSIYIMVAGFLCSITIIVSMYLSRNIKMSLLGHEPEEFAKMYLQREEVLSTLEEGIIAINHEGIVTLFNSAAINMLDIEEKNPEGRYIIDVFPKTELINVIKDKESQYNKDMIINDKVIISNRILIRENDKVMGAVAIFRNKTEVTRLAEQLTGVNQIIDALRANTHEFMNKLHIILGLIQIDRIEDAKRYIVDITEDQREVVSLVMNQIEEPTVAALILGKMSRAKELGIKLRLYNNSCLNRDNKLLNRNSLVTIIGNLLENSIDSINEKDDEIKEINLLISEDAKSLIIMVDDTGMGIKEEHKLSLYKRGFSTKKKNTGIGMYLIKEIVDSVGGEINLETEEGVGTCFTIRIGGEK